MVLQVKVIINNTNPKDKIILENNIFHFYSKSDLYSIQEVSKKILLHFSDFEDKHLAIISDRIDSNTLALLSFQLKLYNDSYLSVGLKNNSYTISYVGADPEFTKKQRLMCELYKDYYEIVRLPSNILNPDTFVVRTKELLTKYKVEHNSKITEYKATSDSKFQAIYSVGKGSIYTPRMLVIEFGSNEAFQYKTAICGKGITHDTGGLNLKTNDSIREMHKDMAGAICSVVVGILYYLLTEISIIVACGIAENAVDERSVKPGDVINSYSGLKIRVDNTDAEGRLVLADVLAWVVDKVVGLVLLITIATLTGASYFNGGIDYLSYVNTVDHENKFNSVVEKAKLENGEFANSLPNNRKFISLYKKAGPFADLSNVAPDRTDGGAYGPAQFLLQFVIAIVKKKIKEFSLSEDKLESMLPNCFHADVANFYDSSLSETISSADLLGFFPSLITLFFQSEI